MTNSEEKLRNEAKAAVRATLARCVRSQIEKLERSGRVLKRLEKDSIEARELFDEAAKLRERAKKAGLA